MSKIKVFRTDGVRVAVPLELVDALPVETDETPSEELPQTEEPTW